MAVITYKGCLELRGTLAELLSILRALHVAGYASNGDVTISLAPQAPLGPAIDDPTVQTSAQPAKSSDQQSAVSNQIKAAVSDQRSATAESGKSSRISRRKTPDTEIDILTFIRRHGGIDPAKTSPDIQGELDALRPRESGTTGIINRNSRYSLRAMAELAAEAGFIRESGSERELLDAITRAIDGEKVYSRYKSDYGKEISKELSKEELAELALTPELAGAMLMGSPN